MIENRNINIIIAVLMTTAVIFTSLFIFFFGSSALLVGRAQPEYVSRIFNKNKVTEISISMKQEDWDWIIQNASKEEYRSADITINGETFYNVGIRPKGNSSLNSIANSNTSDRYSFKIEFDHYIKGQTCYGLDKLVLNNMWSDTTYMKEYLSYDLFSLMGVVTPVYSYSNISINGKPWGLYLAVESGEESFLERNFGGSFGNLFKPEGTGSGLIYTNDAAASYSGIKDNAALKVSDSDFEKVIEMIKNLNSGTNIEKYINVDATLRYFAVNTILVNLDSYAGNFKHNYYLYEEDGKCTILPWDLNMSFAGFQVGNAQQAVDFPIDTPVSGNLDGYPLISKLLEVPKYKELYHKYLDQAIKQYFDSGLFSKSIDKLNSMINNYVKNDATAFTTYEQYENALPVLKEFGKLRAASVTAQLAGSTSSGTVNLNLSAIGSMGGGMGNRQDNQGNLPNAGNFQNGNQGNIPPGVNKPDRNFNNQEGNQRNLPPNTNIPVGNQENLPDRQGNNPGGILNNRNNTAPSSTNDIVPVVITAGICFILMAAGVLFASKYKRRKLNRGQRRNT